MKLINDEIVLITGSGEELGQSLAIEFFKHCLSLAVGHGFTSESENLRIVVHQIQSSTNGGDESGYHVCTWLLISSSSLFFSYLLVFPKRFIGLWRRSGMSLATS
jgi:hypothetical protein